MRVSDKLSCRKFVLFDLQDFEATGCLLLRFVAAGGYQAVLRQSSKGRLQR
jgi:hypothetical protein